MKHEKNREKIQIEQDSAAAAESAVAVVACAGGGEFLRIALLIRGVGGDAAAEPIGERAIVCAGPLQHRALRGVGPCRRRRGHMVGGGPFEHVVVHNGASDPRKQQCRQHIAAPADDGHPCADGVLPAEPCTQVPRVLPCSRMIGGVHVRYGLSCEVEGYGWGLTVAW